MTHTEADSKVAYLLDFTKSLAFLCSGPVDLQLKFLQKSILSFCLRPFFFRSSNRVKRMLEEELVWESCFVPSM